VKKEEEIQEGRPKAGPGDITEKNLRKLRRRGKRAIMPRRKGESRGQRLSQDC